MPISKTIAFEVQDVTDSTVDVTIDWNDGSAAETITAVAADGTTTVTRSHTYSAVGTYNVSVTASDGSLTDTETIQITIDNANAPDLTIVSSPVSGDTVTLTTRINDPDEATNQLSIDWGDGTSASNASEPADGSDHTRTHSYLNDGNYTITVTATDSGGLSTSKTVDITIAVAPTVTVDSGTVSSNVYTLKFTVADDTDNSVNVDVDWGDGSTHYTNNNITVGQQQTLTHTYATDGSRTVTITATDTGGLSGSATDSVTIAVAPQILNLRLV